MRLPLAANLTTRDGTLTKDAKIVNGFVESRGEEAGVFKRPGLINLGSVGTGLAQLLATWAGQIRAIVGDTLANGIVYDTEQYITYPSALSLPVFAALSYGSSKYVAAHGSVSTMGRYSSDGQSWTSAPLPTAASWSCIATNGTNFVAVQRGVSGPAVSNAGAYSADGTSWIATTLPVSKEYRSVCYDGIYYIALGGTSSATARTADGQAWSSSGALPSALFRWWHVFSDSGLGDGYVVALAQGDSVGVATDVYAVSGNSGSTWTGYTFPTVGIWENGFYFAGVYCVCGRASSTPDDTLIFLYTETPDDDSSWTQVNVVSSNGDQIDPQIVGHSDSKICALIGDQNGYITGAMTSSDLDTWVYEAVPIVIDTDAVTRAASDGTNILWLVGYVAPNPYNSLIRYPTAQDVDPYVYTDSTDAIAAITPDLRFYSNISGAAQSNQYMMLKNSEQAFLFDGTTVSLITDVDYPGIHTVAVTSITRVSTTATVTTTAAHPFITGDTVTIAGASPAGYNGAKTVTVTGGSTFTYTIAGSPATPATGTITAQGGSKRTVPGIVYLDGYFFVMTDQAVIYNSDLGDPTTWAALDFITAEIEPGDGVALCKTQNYVCAFKEWSTEFFYDAANSPGSPLSPVMNGFTLVGCASGDSVATISSDPNSPAASIFWISQTKEKGRGVYKMVGTTQTQISTPDVERVLTRSDLSEVFAYGVRISGHSFYILTLTDINVTLAYDSTSNTWAPWSSLTANASTVQVNFITRSGTTATVITNTAHGLSDGDPVTIAGVPQTEYNGIFQIRYVDTTTFTIEVSGGPSTPATGYTLGSSISVSSLSRSGTTATANTATSHGLTTGDLVLIAGATQTDYNGYFQVTVTDADTFTYTVEGSPVSPATGTITEKEATSIMTADGFTETYFKLTYYTYAFGRDLVLHETNGNLYEITESVFYDDDAPINLLLRTGKLDGGSTKPKLEGRCEVIGNKVDATAMIRHSDDDYQTNSKYRLVNLNAERSQIWRQGRFRRRSYDLRFIENTQLQVSSLELDLE